MDKTATLGERIYKYRTARGLSQLELSELLEVSRQSVSKWETDVAVPELSKLVKMAEVFEISLDTLVLGKEEEKEECAEEPEIKEPITPKIEKVRETSRMKTGFGFFFLGVGTLLSFLILLLTTDIPATLFIFIPFGLCAFFCLRQFRHAALWCGESWYVCIMAYFHYATGTYWVPHIAELIHADVLGLNLSTIMSFVFFFMLVFFICLTVLAYRKERFEFSKKKHITLAVIAAVALPVKSAVLWLMHRFWLNLIANGDEYYYMNVIFRNFRIPIYGLNFVIDLAFTALFTACLVPTVYWIRDNLKAKKKL